MKFLIVEPSPLPILIPLVPKYSPQDPVFKYFSTLVIYKLCFKFFPILTILISITTNLSDLKNNEFVVFYYFTRHSTHPTPTNMHWEITIHPMYAENCAFKTNIVLYIIFTSLCLSFIHHLHNLGLKWHRYFHCSCEGSLNY